VGVRSLQFAKVGCSASQIGGKKCGSGDRNHLDTQIAAEGFGNSL